MPNDKTLRSDTFIKVTEIWCPDASGKNLRLASSIYGDCLNFKAASLGKSFEWGEGLPGRALASRRPVVWRDVTRAGFRRIEAARADGLTTGVALPVFSGKTLVAVVVFFCAGGAPGCGAIEVWRQLPGNPDMLGLDDGYYGGLSELEMLSRALHFRRGHGLPGVVWEVGRPCVMADIGDGGAFFRAPAARKGKLTSAVGIPCLYGDEQISVVCLLSSSLSPIARRYEIWVPVPEGDALRQAFAVGDGPAWGEHDMGVRIGKGDGPVGTVWADGMPVARADLSVETSSPIRKAREAGLTRLVALPTYREGVVSAVVAWYF